MRVIIPMLPTGNPRLGDVAAAKAAAPLPRGALALPAVSVPSAPRSPALSPTVREPGGAGPLLWHFWSVTSAQEAYKSTCVRHGPGQNNFQFTRNNWQPQTTALTQAGDEGLGGGREGGGHPWLKAAVPRLRFPGAVGESKRWNP